jgi:hypothetical protein
MRTKNEIKNQLAIAESLAEYSIMKHPMSTSNSRESNRLNAYIQALKYVLGKAKARYDREDI